MNGSGVSSGGTPACCALVYGKQKVLFACIQQVKLPVVVLFSCIVEVLSGMVKSTWFQTKKLLISIQNICQVFIDDDLPFICDAIRQNESYIV